MREDVVLQILHGHFISSNIRNMYDDVGSKKKTVCVLYIQGVIDVVGRFIIISSLTSTLLSEHLFLLCLCNMYT